MPETPEAMCDRFGQPENGPRTVCELPVTGSSGMPIFGANRRDTKSYGLSASAAAVTITADAASLEMASGSGLSSRTERSS